MLRRLDFDHMIAAGLFMALLCALSAAALLAGGDNLPPSATADDFVMPIRPTPRAELIWIWPPTPTPEPLPPAVAAPNGCDQTFRLAGSIDAEGRNQPLAVRMAIAAIVVAEAQSRRMTICELTERTNFLTTWRHAQLNPGSWAAQQFRRPSESSTQVARTALTGQFFSLRGGAMHFDGAFWADNDWRCRPDFLWKGGTTCFYP